MLTLNQAADESGRAKSTISKAIKSGKLSASLNDNGAYDIDPSELFRVFPKKAKGNAQVTAKKLMKQANENSPELAIEIAKQEIEIKYLREQAERAERTAYASEQRLQHMSETHEKALDDARIERDEWREQAKKQTLLLERRTEEAENAKKKRFLWF